MTRLALSLELKSWIRDRRLLALIGALVTTLIVITAWATASDIGQREAQQAASEQARSQWEGRGAANPHGMAHFGDFAFRPTGPLARLDYGVQARLGKVLYMEGHRQNVPLHDDATRAGPLARFSRLDAAFLLQVFVPLMLVFLGATGLAADRQSGRLKLALVQGISARAVLFGHVLALWTLALLLLIVVIATSMITAATLGTDAIPSPGRLAAFSFFYGLFFWVVSGGVVAASVWLRSARAALLALLVIWVAATALLPRVSSGLADAVHPLPSQDAFSAAMQASRADGPDGHNPEDAELDRLRQAMLDEHEVKNVEDLPFNFDGLAMQVDEEFGNQVWDEHFGELRSTLYSQLNLVGLIALLNPFQSIDHLSMAVAGTDLAHDMAFQQQAERYRRGLVEALNREHAYGGSKTGDWSWEAGSEFFAALPQFQYAAPHVELSFRSRALEILGLGLWALLMMMMIRHGADRIETGTLLC